MDNYSKILEYYNMLHQDRELWEIFFTKDYPIPYKNLTLYPVKLDLYFFFSYFSNCLKVPHLTSGDIKAITMSYLEYLFYLITEKNQSEYAYMLGELLLLTLKKNKTYIDSNNNEQDTIRFLFNKKTIEIEGIEYNSKDFDIIREIILLQNGSELPDETIDPDLLNAYYEKIKLDTKTAKYKMGKLDDNINIVIALTSYTRDNIFNLTIRTFLKLYDRCCLIMKFKLETLLVPYMEKKDKDNIIPYNADTTKTLKERIRESFETLGELEKKVKNK